eukprot:6491920-Amphidinium_carterae.2
MFTSIIIYVSPNGEGGTPHIRKHSQEAAVGSLAEQCTHDDEKHNDIDDEKYKGDDGDRGDEMKQKNKVKSKAGGVKGFVNTGDDKNIIGKK